MKKALLIGIFVAVNGLFVGLYIRRPAIAFAGKVIDKDVLDQTNNNSILNGNQPISVKTGNASNVSHQFMIKVLTDSGKTINWQVSESKYEIIKIGAKR